MAKRYPTAAAFRQALEERLRSLARERDQPINDVRQKLVIERLLARLFASAHPPWLLKGGFAMELRYRPKARTTRDLDLSVPMDAPTPLADRLSVIREQLQQAADIDAGDYFEFRIEEARGELPGAPKGGGRFSVEALLAGRRFAAFHVDLGFGDAVLGTPEELHGDTVLDFAGIVPARALAIPKAQQFAEKLHAYTYPWTDRVNTRARDLVDMLVLLERGAMDPAVVKAAAQATFRTRATHNLPTALPLPPETWREECAAMAIEAGLPSMDLAQAWQTLSTYWQTCLAA